MGSLTAYIQFVQYDKLTPEQKTGVSRIPALIKLKQIGVLNMDLLKAGAVVKAVQEGLGNPTIERAGRRVARFSNDTHVRCWRRYNVRPAGNSNKPEFTDQRYCIYDKAHGDYLYTTDWVTLLVELMSNDEQYRSLYS